MRNVSPSPASRWISSQKSRRAFGIDARGRLVEQEQLRLVDQARGQRQPLLPPAGKLSGELRCRSASPSRSRLSRTAWRRFWSEYIRATKSRFSRDAQVFPEAEALGHVPDLALDLLALGDHVVAEAGAAALVGAEQPAEHADERRLAAAVRAEEAADLAAADLQIDVIDDRAAAEALGHAAHVNRELVRHASDAELDIDRLARVQFAATRGVEGDLDHEDQLARGSRGCR